MSEVLVYVDDLGYMKPDILQELITGTFLPTSAEMLGHPFGIKANCVHSTICTSRLIN
ncbi:hypothetical protein AVEN_210257-1, partial [Araneus ventricosus]